MKTKVKFIITFAVIILAMCLFNTNEVKAVESTDKKIVVNNEVQSNLIESIEKDSYFENSYLINVKGLEMITLLQNKARLESLVKSDGYVYENVYVDIDDNATSVKFEYKYYSLGKLKSETKELELTTINDNKYAILPLAVARKIDGIYYHAFLHGDGLHINTSTRVGGTITTQVNEENTSSFSIDIDIPEEDESFNGAAIYLESTKDGKTYKSLGAGWNSTSGGTIDRSNIDDDCKIVVRLPIKAGESINIEPLGTFNYVGTESDNYSTYYTHRYEYKVTDKSILNKESILCRALIPEYKVLHVGEIALTGDFIKIVKKEDTTTKIKLEADTSILPENTQMESTKIENYTNTMLTNTNKFYAYDITLKSNGVKIQPNGKVKISIPIPEGMETNNLVVYRVEDNKLIKYEVTVEEIESVKYATFETDHFSTYVLADVATADNQEENKTATEENTTSTNGEKDNTPKTGTTIIDFILEIIANIGKIIKI